MSVKKLAKCLICVVAFVLIFWIALAGCAPIASEKENYDGVPEVVVRYYEHAKILGYTGELAEFLQMVEGRGIENMTIDDDGHLIIDFTDGTNCDLGEITGKPGRGIDNVFINADGHLIIVYDDGSSIDCGLVTGAKGAPGADGAKGKDGADGKDGKDGIDGQDGKDGKDGVDGKDGTNGIDGKDGENGVDGKDGQDGKDGANGADGRGIERMYIEDNAIWVVYTDSDEPVKIGELKSGLTEAYEVYKQAHPEYEKDLAGWIDDLVSFRLAADDRTSNPEQHIVLVTIGTIQTTQFIKDGERIDLSVFTPKKEGHKFLYWVTSEGDIFDDNTPITKDMIITAMFEPDKQEEPDKDITDIADYTANIFDEHAPEATMEGYTRMKIILRNAPDNHIIDLDGWLYTSLTFSAESGSIEIKAYKIGEPENPIETAAFTYDFSDGQTSVTYNLNDKIPNPTEDGIVIEVIYRNSNELEYLTITGES